MKVRPLAGGCYYIDEEPDETGLYKGVNKYSETDALLRWGTEDRVWVVVWEAELDIRRWMQ